MEAISEGWTIVVLGSWNPNIFTPDWITKNLAETQEPQIGIGIPINNYSLPIRMDFENILLSVSMTQLVLSPKLLEDDCLKFMQKVGEKILSSLPHTPVTAMGMNFRFKVTDSIPEKLKDAFIIKDKDYLSENNLNYDLTAVTRRIKLDDSDLNFSLEYDNEKNSVMIECNFHKDVKDTELAKEFLSKGYIESRDQVKDIIQKLYGLEA